MKWLFRVIGAILLAFILSCVIGFFMPTSQVVETHVLIKTEADELFLELSDLRGYPNWFYGFEGIDASQIVYAGAQNGLGSSAAWRAGKDNQQFGGLKISQLQNGSFVALDHELGSQNVSLTYALMPEESGGKVLLLTRYEAPLGGFPYLARLRGKLTQGGIETKLNRSMQSLKSSLEF